MKKIIAIIGGGPAAMILAAQLDTQKFDVTIYERNAALGRKFLVAGDGGFNLTHSEEIENFISRYTPVYFFEKIISSFTNTNLRAWLKSIGIETIVGSSKRVFPAGGIPSKGGIVQLSPTKTVGQVSQIKPIDVLNSILNVLKKKNVPIKTQHLWKGWNSANELLFETNDTIVSFKADIIVFALGGGSWKVTGSDGNWTNYFKEKEIEIIPFQASNCAYEIKWGKEFIETAEGNSLKNISLKCGNKEKKGEVVITKFGLEGGAIYALSPNIRQQLNAHGKATVLLDLKPTLTVEEIKSKITGRGNKSLSKQLEDELNINKVQLALLKAILNKEEFTSPEILSEKIKTLPLIITAAAPIDEAISTVGGISLSEIDEDFQLKKLSNHYVIGEMLDWDAPTGGYLLQACFSMGNYLAKFLNT
ncbi:MAG: TIGR03862 family flavoprotein [Bacteroidetes bacterium]|nr:TIGR03862 family flavoprotein [Bacteroidota bacterium]